jgi:hypothetical protein
MMQDIWVLWVTVNAGFTTHFIWYRIRKAVENAKEHEEDW